MTEVEPAPTPTSPKPANTDDKKDDQKDTRVKYIIAGIALGATLAGAIIGVVGSVYVTGVNTNTSREVAQISADTARRVAEYNFLHVQRQAAYASFLTNHDGFFNAQNAITAIKNQQQTNTPSGQAYLDRHDELNTFFNKLKTDQSLITVLKGKETSDVEQYAELLVEADREVWTIYFDNAGDPLSSSVPTKQQEIAEKLVAAMNAAIGAS